MHYYKTIINYNINNTMEKNKDVEWNYKDLQCWIEDNCKKKVLDVTTLDISKNKLKKLPNEIFKLTNLKYLNCSCNELTELSEDIGKLTKLMKLDCSNNKIKKTYKSLEKCIQLDYLNCDNNNSIQISKNIINTIKQNMNDEKDEYYTDDEKDMYQSNKKIALDALNDEIEKWTPSFNSEKWEKYKDNDNVQKYTDVPIVNYSVTHDLIEKIKKCDKDDILKNTDVDKEYAIYYVYKISGNHSNDCAVGYSKSVIYNVLLKELHGYFYKLNKEKYNKIKGLIDEKNKIEDLSISLISVYMAKSNYDISSDMNKIKNAVFSKKEKEAKMNKKTENNVIANNEIFNDNFDACDYVKKLVNDDKKEKEYCIQKIYSKNVPDDIYVFGSFEMMSEGLLKEYVKNKCINFQNGALKFGLIGKCKVKYEIEGLITLENYIVKNKTMNIPSICTGNISDIKKLIFIALQREKMKNAMKNVKYCDGNYVAYIGNEKEKIVFHGIGNVYQQLKKIYSIIYNRNVIDESLNFLTYTDWEKIEVKPLEINIQNDDVDGIYDYYKVMFEKAIPKKNIQPISSNNFGKMLAIGKALTK